MNFIDKLELPEKVKKALKILIIVFLVFLFSYITYIAFIESDQKKIERQINSGKEYEFNGIVKRKYIDWNHKIPTTVLKSGKKIGSDYGLYNDVIINDSISKEIGEFDVKIFRKKNDSTKYKYVKTVYLNSLHRKYK